MQAFASEDEVGKGYLTSNFMVKLLQFINYGASTSQARSQQDIGR